MILIDFLVYYLTYWFEKRREKLVWSTPLQRSIYAIMLASAGTLAFFKILVDHTIGKQKGFKIPSLVCIILAIALDFILEYVYIKRGRYENVASKRFSLEMNKGAVISIVIIFFCAIGWLGFYMLIVPPGSNNH